MLSYYTDDQPWRSPGLGGKRGDDKRGDDEGIEVSEVSARWKKGN